MARAVDNLLYFWGTVSSFFLVLIFTMVLVFAIIYRRRSESERPRPITGSLKLELLWTSIPLFLVMIMFGWGAKVFYDLQTPPRETLNLYVVGKQWMWKIQHPEGNREINELHVPVGTPVKLQMTSEDVIHSFYVPAFRIKMDVVPGRYTTAWFEATKPGKYHLFCAEFCGTDHSRMVGSVYVMEPDEYQAWLVGDTGPALSMAEAGGQLFNRLSCHTCHSSESGSRGPDLAGIYGQPVSLISGETVIADEDYLRESILDPTAKIVAGYAPVMPTFRGQLNEEELLRLIAYIRSLSGLSNPEVRTEERTNTEQ